MGRGTRRPGREQNITSPGCSFKSSAVAVWGTHHQSGAVAQQGGTMYLSRITLHTGKLSPAQLLHLVDRGEYVMHQWLWDLFPGGKERQFLYRREELQGRFAFLSCRRNARRKVIFSPSNADHLRQSCVPDNPFVSTCGRIQQFVKRANATTC